MQKLNNEELMRMYTLISNRHYRFAKNAWYIPIGMDQRLPDKGGQRLRSPDTLDRMAEFQNTAKSLGRRIPQFYRRVGLGYITENDIEKAILRFSGKNIAIPSKANNRARPFSAA